MPGLGETKVVERFGPRRQLCGDAKTPVQMGTMHAPSGDDAVGPICSVDQRPAVVFNPVTPVIEAGMRTEPAVSVPNARLAVPLTNETPAPELEPPGVRC